MAYLNQDKRSSPGSLAAVIAVHAGLGAALVLGLQVAVTITPEPDDPTTFNIPKTPPPPPEVIEDPAPTPKTAERIVTAPEVEIDLSNAEQTVNVIEPDILTFPPIGGTETGTGIEIALPTPTPIPTPAFDPVSAKPRNDPALWITANDYRPSWIRREWVGTARFTLNIAANGRVENCTITGSTGHGALDAATCKLIQKRAKFQPARSSAGEAVPGTFTNAVRWELPE